MLRCRLFNLIYFYIFFFKQKTAYEMRISDWSSDVCSSDLADNQYEGQDVPKLTSPILAGQADMVIGARPISETEHFSWIKKKLQHLGSWAVRVASKTDVADAPSGFRAISREAAMSLTVFNPYPHTLETTIQTRQTNNPASK